MKYALHIMTALLLSFAVSCGTHGSDKSSVKGVKAVHLSTPVPPSVMDSGEKYAYVCDHYFDDITRPASGRPCTQTLVSGVAVAELEQAVANYLDMLESLPLDKAQAIIASLADKMTLCASADTTSNILTVFAPILERYAYDPNSPVRDEDIYGAYARRMSTCHLFPEVRRSVYASDAEACRHNERGSKAADFSFTTAQGKVYSLYGIRAEYTILFFSNPGCHACKDIIDALSGSISVQNMVLGGRVAVVNVYIDEDLAAWMDYMPIYPVYWYNGYDHNGIIRSDELYNVRAIPSLYLLDADKKVVLKDCTTEKLMTYISSWE